MGFKTILVHLGPDGESDRRMATAADFARRQDARLRGLYAVLPMDVPGVRTGATLTDAREAAEQAAAPVRERFQALCAREGLRHDWLLDVGDPAEHLALHARYADAVIISQDAPKSAWEDFHADLSEFLPFATSTPVLVLPRGRDALIAPDHVAIAWKSSKEAASAVRAALPLLKEAKAVTVVTVQNPADHQIHGAGLTRFLAEHGIAADLVSTQAGDHEVAQTLLTEVRLRGAGLVVMGVYGHSRLRTRILGGVSKYVLQHAEVPVLVTH